jgi:LysM repeat protein
MIRKHILVPAILIVVLLLGASGRARIGRAQAVDPYSLIDAVNALRAANGLPAYKVNNILMSIAQAHSDYQASIGQWTHIGPGGTRPRDRAAAAGYGGGATFFISENVAEYANASVDDVVSSWMQDADHIGTMLGVYVDVGAGVSEAGGIAYYTLDAAYVAGSGSYIPPNTITPGGPTALPYFAVQTVTPMPDGSIVHVVQLGQNLSIIGKAYGISAAEIMDLNNLTSANIYVGDRLIIRKASTPGPTATTTATTTPTRAATPTHKPTRTPTPTSSPVVTTTEALAVQDVAQGGGSNNSTIFGSILVIAIIVLAGGGILLMLVGSLLKRRAKPGLR